MRIGGGDSGRCSGSARRTAVTAEVVLGLFWSGFG